MKASEFIRMLSEHDPDAEILIAAPTGNYWRQVAAREPEWIESKRVSFSAYLDSDEVKDDDDEYSEDQRRALLIFTR